MRTVVQSREVAHLWAHRSQQSARAPSNTRFDGEIIYSYAEPIGRLVRVKGVDVALFRDRSFSVTTSKHQSWMRQAASHLTHFTVADIGYHFAPGVVDHKKNLAAFAAAIPKLALEAKRARSHKDWKIRELESTIATANRYAETFGLKTRFTLPSDTDIESLYQAAKVEAQKRAIANKEADARRKLEHEAAMVEAAKQLELWKGGASVPFPSLIRISYNESTRVYSEAYGRIVGDTLETSHGAIVPLDHIRRVAPIIRRLLDNGEEYRANGHTIHLGEYTLDSISKDGTIRAGCHTFDKTEAYRILALVEAA